MKKTVATLSVLLMVLAMSGCGQDGVAESEIDKAVKEGVVVYGTPVKAEFYPQPEDTVSDEAQKQEDTVQEEADAYETPAGAEAAQPEDTVSDEAQKQEDTVQEETDAYEAPAGAEAAQPEDTVGDEAQITVSIPEGWEARNPAPVRMLYKYRKLDEKGYLVFQLGKAFITADTLDEAVQQSQDKIIELYDDVQFSETEHITVDGVDAIKFIFTGTNGETMKFERIYFITGGELYGIYFNAGLVTTFDDNAADFPAILDSISIN